MSVNEIASLLREAEDISRTDVGKAIALLEEFQGNGSFWPWGALALLRLYIKDHRLEGASLLCESFSAQYPSFMPAFGSRLRLHRGKSEYLAEVASMFAVVASAERHPAWFRRDFIEIVMGSASPDFADVVERGLASGVLEPIHAAGMKRLMPMIVGIDAFMKARRRYPAPSGHAPAGWMFAFLDSGSACVEMNNIVYVNLAPLRLATIEGWEKELAGIFAIVVCGLMNWAPYVDDSGVLSWPSVKSEDAYTAIFQRLLISQVRKVSRKTIKHSKGIQVAFGPGELWVRPGNTEQWALWSYLMDANAARAAAEEVAERMASADDAVVQAVMTESWWPRLSAANNIIRLNINCGWYAKPGRGAGAFANWAERYLAALTAGKLLPAHTSDLLRLMPLIPSLRGKQRHSWSDAALLSALDGADAVVVSAYAHQIARHFETGGLHALWGDLGFDAKVRSLATVQAPMSIWPYYPDDSWSASFEVLCDETDRAITESNAGVLVASCGAYGLPLVHEMHRRRGILCIYFGHAVNVYFGIYTNAFERHAFYARNPRSRHWVAGDLGRRYAALARVDAGRYMSGGDGG